MPERSNGAVSKTVDPFSGSGGSNPPLSASLSLSRLSASGARLPTRRLTLWPPSVSRTRPGSALPLSSSVVVAVPVVAVPVVAGMAVRVAVSTKLMPAAFVVVV